MEYVVQNPSLIRRPINISLNSSGVFSGSFSQDGNKLWLVERNCLHCINIDDGVCMQKWKCNFGDIYYIKEVVCGNNQFLVAVTAFSEANVSGLVLLNASSLSVVKSIYFIEKISCITSFEIYECGSFANLLMTFDGILVVGCYGGRTYLVNLNLSRSVLHHSLPIKVISAKDVIQEDLYNADHVALLLLQGYS